MDNRRWRRDPSGQFPWDVPGEVTEDEKEIVHRANVFETHLEHTSAVNASWRGASPHGVMDMALGICRSLSE